MTRYLRWTRLAVRRLESICDYIALDNPTAADRVNARIRSLTETLRAHPAMGRGGRITGTRELVLADLPYISAYRVTETRVEVLAIIHTSQRWPETF